MTTLVAIVVRVVQEVHTLVEVHPIHIHALVVHAVQAIRETQDLPIIEVTVLLDLLM